MAEEGIDITEFGRDDPRPACQLYLISPQEVGGAFPDQLRAALAGGPEHRDAGVDRVGQVVVVPAVRRPAQGQAVRVLDVPALLEDRRPVCDGLDLDPARRCGLRRFGRRVTGDERAVARAQRLIDARQYVLDSDWGDVQPSAADENAFLETHDWEEYARWHLGPQSLQAWRDAVSVQSPSAGFLCEGE